MAVRNSFARALFALCKQNIFANLAEFSCQEFSTLLQEQSRRKMRSNPFQMVTKNLYGLYCKTQNFLEIHLFNWYKNRFFICRLWSPPESVPGRISLGVITLLAVSNQASGQLVR
jgi:hypothetical protein